MRQAPNVMGMEGEQRLAKVLIPTPTVIPFFRGNTLEALCQFVVQALDFTVGLRMARGRSIVVDVVSLDESLEVFRSEFFSIVRDDLGRFSVGPNDVLQDLDCRGC